MGDGFIMFKKYTLIYQCAALAVMLSTQTDARASLFSQALRKRCSVVKINCYSAVDKLLKPFKSLSQDHDGINLKNTDFGATKTKPWYTKVTNFIPSLFLSPNTNRSNYLADASGIYKAYGENTKYSHAIEQLKLRALNEYAKSKTPDYQELSVVDLDLVADIQALDNIPFCSSAIQDFPPSKSKRVFYKKKFLLHKGLPVGWIRYEYDKREAHGHIDYVGVARTQRKSGYGSYLMTYALYDMQIAGARKVDLFSSSNAATAFHNTLGFHQCGYTMTKHI